VVFTDGSKEPHTGVGYGYAIYRTPDPEPRATGLASLSFEAEVFDAETVGAWRGLEHALRITGDDEQITVCLDNTAAIWCLRGRASDTSQWAFLAFHEAAQHRQVKVKWCPGHMGIPGNEQADELAKAGLTAAADPRAGPTMASMGALRRTKYQDVCENDWHKTQGSLSQRYKSWSLDYSLRCPPELEAQLPRGIHHRLLALRTGHGDFAWYHRRFKHEDANLQCSCGAYKSPEHLVFCRRALATFAEWPWPDRPKIFPETSREKRLYLKDLQASPRLFRKFLQITGFFSSICPRDPT
jgi:ribonuclease HI